MAEADSLSSQFYDLSLSTYMGRTKRDRFRRRGLSSDALDALESPVIELDRDSGSLFVSLADLVVSVIRLCLVDGRAVLEEVASKVASRKYFDTMSQSYVSPKTTQKEHIAFIIANDPVVSRLYIVDSERITER